MLVIPYQPQASVIQQEYLQRDLVFIHNLQFLDIHLEASIAGDAKGLLPGGAIGPDSCRQCEAHSPEAGRLDKVLAFAYGKRRIRPKLVLSNVQDEVRISIGKLRQAREEGVRIDSFGKPILSLHRIPLSPHPYGLKPSAIGDAFPHMPDNIA